MVDLIVGIAAASQGVCRTLRSLQFLRPGRTWNLKTTGLYRGKLSFRVPFSVHIRVFGSVPSATSSMEDRVLSMEGAAGVLTSTAPDGTSRTTQLEYQVFNGEERARLSSNR